MLVYAVISSQTEKAVRLFVHREHAERFLENARADQPELAERLRIEPVELETSGYTTADFYEVADWWVRECGTTVDGQGRPVDVEAIPEVEWAEDIRFCDAVDLTRVYRGEEFASFADAAEWRCPTCGGTDSCFSPITAEELALALGHPVNAGPWRFDP